MRMVLGALAAMIAGAASAQTPAETTVETLRAHYDAYDRKRVRVTGQIDACWRVGCFLCPETMTRATYQPVERCLQIEIEGVSGDPKQWRASRAVAAAYRYATVTLDARFDATCVRPEVVCTGTIPSLADGRVISVQGRRRSDEGLAFDMALRVPSRAEERELIAAYKAAVPPRWFETPGWSDTLPIKAFMAERPDDAAKRWGVVCMWDADGPPRWPTHWGTPGLADPYVCTLLGEWDGRWRMLPHDR